LWCLQQEKSARKIAEGFSFQLVDRHKIDHTSLPDISFVEGCFFSIKGKTEDGYNYCTTHSGLLEARNCHFPSILTLETDTEAEQAKVKHSVVLSDVELMAV